MTGTKLSRKKILNAIPGSGGIIQRVAMKAGYSWGAVNEYIKADPLLVAMMEHEEETINDLAENTIIKKIADGDEASAKWWLARRRRQRFGDNVDVTSGGKSFEKMTDDQLLAILSAISKTGSGETD